MFLDEYKKRCVFCFRGLCVKWLVSTVDCALYVVIGLLLYTQQ